MVAIQKLSLLAQVRWDPQRRPRWPPEPGLGEVACGSSCNPGSGRREMVVLERGNPGSKEMALPGRAGGETEVLSDSLHPREHPPWPLGDPWKGLATPVPASERSTPAQPVSPCAGARAAACESAIGFQSSMFWGLSLWRRS